MTPPIQQMLYGVGAATDSGAYDTWSGDRAGWGGGYSSGNKDEIDYRAIASTGDASDFGDLTDARGATAAVSGGGTGSATRGCWNCGNGGTTTIDYISWSSTGDATDFGDASPGRNAPGAVSSGLRGIIGGGYAGGNTSSIDFYTIATTSDTSDFGNLTEARHGVNGCNSNTRGLFTGGWGSSSSPTIDYITMATESDATDFGDINATGLAQRHSNSATSNLTRGLIQGGGDYDSGARNVYDSIEYVTIASTSNTTDFGDLTTARYYSGSNTNLTRALCGGGRLADRSTDTDTIDYVTIASTGDSTDFGDITVARHGNDGASGAS